MYTYVLPWCEFNLCLILFQHFSWTTKRKSCLICRSILSVAFAREWEPGTILMFGAPERLVNERFVEDNEDGEYLSGSWKETQELCLIGVWRSFFGFSHCKWFRHSEFWCSLGLGNPRHFKTCGWDEVDCMYSKVIFMKLCKVQNLNIADFQYDGRKCANVMKRCSAYTPATMDILTTLP